MSKLKDDPVLWTQRDGPAPDDHKFRDVNVRLDHVLQHLEADPELGCYALTGMYRYNGLHNARKAFKRTHVYSFVLLNLWDQAVKLTQV
jgi:hypothetical protein